MRFPPICATRTLRRVFTSAFVLGAAAFFGAQAVSAATSYFTFDIHSGGGSGTDNQVFWGSAALVNITDPPIPPGTGTSGPYYLALDLAAYNLSPTSYSGYMLWDTATSQQTTTTNVFTLTHEAVTQYGYGQLPESGSSCLNAGTPSATPSPAGSNGCQLTPTIPTGPGAGSLYALSIYYDSANNRGWTIDTAAFGFTTSQGNFWVEGSTTVGPGATALDSHVATINGDGTYRAVTGGTSTTLNNGVKVECMPPNVASQTNGPYCTSLAATPLPEISASTLPRAMLLLASAFLVVTLRRRNA
jgi:hypothetical protein